MTSWITKGISMLTKIDKVNSESLALAKQIMLNSGVVAFPTETVYGLGAIATDDIAVKQIYAVKGRPSDNPLIVHIHKEYDIEKLVKKAQPYVTKLFNAFVPGPLTMVFESRNTVSNIVTCGGDTLAIRVPSHKDAQSFLSYIDMPVAAPSANLSKHVSPVTAQHVYNDLNGKIRLILDGGKCEVGIESTVLDVTGDIPKILRPGFVTQEMVASVCGDCQIARHLSTDKVRSPGVKYKHYSPNCKTLLYNENQLEEVLLAYNSALKDGKKPYVLCGDDIAKKLKVKNLLNLGGTPIEMASNLYDLLLYGENVADIIIGVEPIEKKGLLSGVTNRLEKACAQSK